MRDIDRVAACMMEEFCGREMFAGLEHLIVNYATAARHAAETMKKDPIIFQVWPKFVSLGEKLDEYRPNLPDNADQMLRMTVKPTKANMVYVYLNILVQGGLHPDGKSCTDTASFDGRCVKESLQMPLAIQWHKVVDWCARE